MNQLDLYNHILQLASPWFVSAVDLNESDQKVLVTVSFDFHSTLYCPKCSAPCRLYDLRQRHWRHLDTCQLQTYIQADIPRVNCLEHGVHTVQVPWAAGSSHYSKAFEDYVVSLAKTSSFLSISKQISLSWSCIDRIVKRAVTRGLVRRWKVDCRYLNVDETAIGKGRKFITVLSNHQGQILSIEDGKSGNSLLACLKSLPIQFLLKTKTISMDMSAGYINAVKEFWGPRYKRMISIDHFHIAKLLTKAVNLVRKDDLKLLPSLERMKSHKVRYCWLRNGNKLSPAKEAELAKQKELMVNTARAWTLKEKAGDIWYGIEPKTLRSWKIWLGLVNDSGLRPLQTAAGTISNHLDGIMNSIRTNTSNARAEAINKNIKNLGRSAHSFRNKERYKLAILLRYGKLDMKLNH